MQICRPSAWAWPCSWFPGVKGGFSLALLLGGGHALRFCKELKDNFDWTEFIHWIRSKPRTPVTCSLFLLVRVACPNFSRQPLIGKMSQLLPPWPFLPSLFSFNRGMGASSAERGGDPKEQFYNSLCYHLGRLCLFMHVNPHTCATLPLRARMCVCVCSRACKDNLSPALLKRITLCASSAFTMCLLNLRS